MALDNISTKMAWNVTMNLDRISAVTTYVMWREESLWNICVLRRVNLTRIMLMSRSLAVSKIWIWVYSGENI
jgi:hypothetical protein